MSEVIPLTKYHFTLGIPERLIPAGGMLIRWTVHAIEAYYFDSRHAVETPYPKTINFSEWEVIEVKTENGRNWKEVLIRRVFDSVADLCLVITKDGCVKTSWFQNTHDFHSTLDVSKYATE